MEEPDKGLVVADLSLRFPDGAQALRGVSFSLAPGTRALVAGPNGAGKTVLGRVIAGLLSPTGGSVRIDGLPPGFAWDREAPVGMVFQNPEHQIVGQTVWEDVLFGPQNLGLSPAEIEERGIDALEVMGLLHRREEDPYHLSGGERRRLAIAGVLALRPRLLFLDEPFAGLDYPSLRGLLEALDSPALRELPVLVATHEISTFLRMTHRLLVLRDGELVYAGEPKEALPHLEAWDLRPPEGP